MLPLSHTCLPPWQGLMCGSLLIAAYRYRQAKALAAQPLRERYRLHRRKCSRSPRRRHLLHCRHPLHRNCTRCHHRRSCRRTRLSLTSRLLSVWHSVRQGCASAAAGTCAVPTHTTSLPHEQVNQATCTHAQAHETVCSPIGQRDPIRCRASARVIENHGTELTSIITKLCRGLPNPTTQPRLHRSDCGRVVSLLRFLSPNDGFICQKTATLRVVGGSHVACRFWRGVCGRLL